MLAKAEMMLQVELIMDIHISTVLQKQRVKCIKHNWQDTGSGGLLGIPCVRELCHPLCRVQPALTRME